jgi:hypothetical protein
MQTRHSILSMNETNSPCGLMSELHVRLEFLDQHHNLHEITSAATNDDLVWPGYTYLMKSWQTSESTHPTPPESSVSFLATDYGPVCFGDALLLSTTTGVERIDINKFEEAIH